MNSIRANCREVAKKKKLKSSFLVTSLKLKIEITEIAIEAKLVCNIPAPSRYILFLSQLYTFICSCGKQLKMGGGMVAHAMPISGYF